MNVAHGTEEDAKGRIPAFSGYGRAGEPNPLSFAEPLPV
jgi:hypothetical protein